MASISFHGKLFPVYGEGINVRDWLYVEDHYKTIDLINPKFSVVELAEEMGWSKANKKIKEVENEVYKTGNSSKSGYR